MTTLNNIVFGAGLPRSGTTSLAAALEILGAKVAHYCPITNPSTKGELDKEYDAYVSSELLLNANFSNGRWVLLHRAGWLESMYAMGQDLCEWQEHMKIWDTIKDVKEANILQYHVDDGWEPICWFLQKRIPNVKYPRLNERL